MTLSSVTLLRYEDWFGLMIVTDRVVLIIDKATDFCGAFNGSKEGLEFHHSASQNRSQVGHSRYFQLVFHCQLLMRIQGAGTKEARREGMSLRRVSGATERKHQ